MNKIEIGKLIRSIRKGKEITMIELTKKIGVTQPTLSKIETGMNEISIELLSKICREFNISLSQFFLELERRNNRKAVGDCEGNTEENLMYLISGLDGEQKQTLYNFLRSISKPF
ncbi:DNA-binding transcriptional regulator, XRE-family HTH domain [Oceanobacillus limi]|uniref:DNA-binding transcriptional regulator, XRE-family HTH domain n=1 Tax=Oceanobacillus limi TaxID=930131 RepID=A0A1I0CUZ9_9BACI|nr:helix-turn-helix transcriptional regulator [Oceanobacillus limi]SET23628.1 DNA-binding transcriptional regulator, XRE-family HTH domain [Oceanobacillus limi]